MHSISQQKVDNRQKRTGGACLGNQILFKFKCPMSEISANVGFAQTLQYAFLSHQTCNVNETFLFFTSVRAAFKNAPFFLKWQKKKIKNEII